MYPANQYIDPYYSHCRDHAPYLYCPPPGWEAGHPQMAMDSAYRSPSYGPWLCSANMNHSHPPEFHSCCNQTYSPGYYSFRPPVPHELPPPHLYCHGPFPHHPNAYPSYFVPSPPYPVDHTPYGYDKLKSHCCGCSNHVCHGEEKSSLKIEEERPEVKPESELNGVDNSSMIRHLNHQYPVIWLPPGNMKDRDNGRSFELPPQLLSRSVPQNGEKTGDVKQHEQDSEKKKFQWPIIWMPTGYNEPKQEAKEFKEVDENPKVSGEAPSSPKIKIIPLSWFENDHHAQNPAAKDGPGDYNEASLLTNQSLSTEHRDGTPVDGNFKTIPVVPKKPDNENKPVGQNYKTIPAVPVKRSDEKKVGTCRTIPVLPQKESDGKKTELSENKEEKKTNNAEKEGDHGKRNNIESSKARHSKLPPVCLRVDPLPRKKSGNGSSRSLSPPTRKDAGKDKKDVKEAQSQNKETKLSDPKKESNVSVVKVKSPDETHKSMASMGATVQAASVKHTQEEQTPTSMDDQKVQPSVDVEAQENAGAKILQGCDKSTKENECVIQGEAPKSARRDGINLSESDAAVRIQSAYRGYYIRRWQPLEKLRKINEVHEQIQGVKKQMQRLEASSKQPTVKEQVPVNETIMNLLLKLDTIQGLHPSVREARKSVARELICLQEKLDSLCKQPSGEPNHTKSEEEKPERFENDIQTTAHVSKEETCEDQEKYARVGEKQEPSLINSKELVHDEVISGVSMELRQDPDPSGQRHQMEESCTTKEAAHDEGKVEAAPDGCKGGASTDVMHDAALSGHSIEQEHQVEESNANSSEESPEEKSAAKGEDQGESSLDYMEPLHGAILSEGTNFPKKCTTSTEHDSHTQESNTGVSPAATEDGTTAMATASLGSGVAFDKGGSVEGQDRQVRESAAVESSELKHDVVPAEEDQCKEPSAPFVHLDDSSLSLEDSESHEHDPVVYDPEDQAEDRDANMQKQVSDATKDSMEDQDGTAEPSVGHTNKLNHVIAADVETSQSDSALKPTVLEESEVTNQCEKFGKADSALVDQQNEPHVENPTGGSAIGEVPLTVASEKEAETKENTLNAAGSLNNRGAERTLHESKSSELPCEHDGTRVHENTSSVESMKNDAQKKLADGDETSLVMGAVECNEMLKEAPVQADNPKEDAGMQIDSEEVASVSATHDGLKNDDEKNLAEENQKLKEMLQNLLACGNDQMGAISELSEKVKTLERKLARKRRPKVRVNRPARNATAKVH